MSLPICPKCESEYTYEDGLMFVCPMCNYEWNEKTLEALLVKDVNGNVLEEDDSVSVIRDLKIKGAPTLKQNTVIKNIKLRPEEDENVICRVAGVGTLFIKSEYLKKI